MVTPSDIIKLCPLHEKFQLETIMSDNIYENKYYFIYVTKYATIKIY